MFLNARLPLTLPLLWMAISSFQFSPVLPAFADSAHFNKELANRELGGRLEAEINGKAVAFTALKTDMKVHLSGSLATVEVKQTFSNPSNKPMHATYLFPLPNQAAVHGMTMKVGDEWIESKIKKKKEAEETFEKAKTEGKAASLLTQHRPNMFTQKVANLMPNKPVEVTLSYVQKLSRKDGQYELVLPLVVGPRYQPNGISGPGVIAEKQNLPTSPPVANITAPPSAIDPDRVSIQVEMESPLPVENVFSPTHPLSVQQSDPKHVSILLKEGRVIDNKDFVLRYRMAGEKTAAGLLTHQDHSGKYFTLTIEPPQHIQSHFITPREMVFVMDTSGSMDGEPLQASKRFMMSALKQLRSTDYFRIIRFSNNAQEFTKEPVLATPENIKKGLSFVNSLTADGGTESMAAMHQALDVAPKAGTMRMMMFLTDGYIGNEYEVLSELKKKIGKGRVYALGVGTSVNRFLLDEMAMMGRGFVRYIDPTTESLDLAAEDLANKLETPVLTDVSIDWGDWQVKSVYPNSFPDVFSGDALVISGQFINPGHHNLIIKGLMNGKPVSLPVSITIPEGEIASTPEIPVIWARTHIDDLMRKWRAPLGDGEQKTDLNKIELEVTQIGLAHHLVTDWTSFVAVSRKIVNPDSKNTPESQVAQPMVDGVTEMAYGDSDPNEFSGNSVPEPEEWALLILFCLFATWVLSSAYGKPFLKMGGGA